MFLTSVRYTLFEILETWSIFLSQESTIETLCEIPLELLFVPKAVDYFNLWDLQTRKMFGRSLYTLVIKFIELVCSIVPFPCIIYKLSKPIWSVFEYRLPASELTLSWIISIAPPNKRKIGWLRSVTWVNNFFWGEIYWSLPVWVTCVEARHLMCKLWELKNLRSEKLQTGSWNRWGKEVPCGLPEIANDPCNWYPIRLFW